jgi:hypothetical protein
MDASFIKIVASSAAALSSLFSPEVRATPVMNTLAWNEQAFGKSMFLALRSSYSAPDASCKYLRIRGRAAPSIRAPKSGPKGTAEPTMRSYQGKKLPLLTGAIAVSLRGHLAVFIA